MRVYVCVCVCVLLLIVYHLVHYHAGGPQRWRRNPATARLLQVFVLMPTGTLSYRKSCSAVFSPELSASFVYISDTDCGISDKNSFRVKDGPPHKMA